MELQVTITLSDKLFALLEDKLPNLGRRVEKAITKELGAQTRRESSIELTVSPDTSPTVPTDREKQTPAKSAAPVVAADEVPQTKASAQKPDKSPAEMIREIVHATRQRFEGEDYKDNTGSESYKKYHRALTSQFKIIATTLGYDKPSNIDTLERVEAFKAECDALIIDDNGFIAPPPAPY